MRALVVEELLAGYAGCRVKFHGFPFILNAAAEATALRCGENRGIVLAKIPGRPLNASLVSRIPDTSHPPIPAIEDLNFERLLLLHPISE